jgi:hypothetical protein
MSKEIKIENKKIFQRRIIEGIIKRNCLFFEDGLSFNIIKAKKEVNTFLHNQGAFASHEKANLRKYAQQILNKCVRLF